MPELGYALVDADNHYYEPRDCFTRHIDAGHRERTLRIVRNDDNAEVVLVGDRVFTCLDRPFRNPHRPEPARDPAHFRWGRDAH